MFDPREQESEGGNTAGGFLAGLVIGGLTGAGTALLLAPQSGRKTRAEIQQKGMELRDQTKETVENTMQDARAKARQVTTPASKQVKALRERGQAMLEDRKDDLNHAIDQVQAK